MSGNNDGDGILYQPLPRSRGGCSRTTLSRERNDGGYVGGNRSNNTTTTVKVTEKGKLSDTEKLRRQIVSNKSTLLLLPDGNGRSGGRIVDLSNLVCASTEPEQRTDIKDDSDAGIPKEETERRLYPSIRSVEAIPAIDTEMVLAKARVFRKVERVSYSDIRDSSRQRHGVKEHRLSPLQQKLHRFPPLQEKLKTFGCCSSERGSHGGIQQKILAANQIRNLSPPSERLPAMQPGFSVNSTNNTSGITPHAHNLPQTHGMNRSISPYRCHHQARNQERLPLSVEVSPNYRDSYDDACGVDGIYDDGLLRNDELAELRKRFSPADPAFPANRPVARGIESKRMNLNSSPFSPPTHTPRLSPETPQAYHENRHAPQRPTQYRRQTTPPYEYACYEQGPAGPMPSRQPIRSPPSPTQHNHHQLQQQHSQQMEVEISPGVFAPLRGSTETWRALENGDTATLECMCCCASLVCISDAEFVLCPDCKVVSPVYDSGMHYRHHSNLSRSSLPEHRTRWGVGLGLHAWQAPRNIYTGR